MKQALFGLLLALQFLTRIPISMECPWEKVTIKQALRSYGLVGLVVGAILAVVWFVVASWFPLWFGALAILTLWVFLTGGLHLDGLMDIADATGSNRSLSKKRMIMKDPHVGSFAVLTIFFHLLWKLGLVYGLLPYTLELSILLLAILIIPGASRLIALHLLYFSPLMKEEGLAYEWKKHLTGTDVVIATLLVGIVTVFSPILVFLFLSYVVYFFLVRAWIIRNFKGINGDLLGASIEGGEIWGLLTLWIYMWFVMG